MITEYASQFGITTTTVNKNYLRGAILRHGDLNIREMIKVLKRKGYDETLSSSLKGWKIVE